VNILIILLRAGAIFAIMQILGEPLNDWHQYAVIGMMLFWETVLRIAEDIKS